MVRWKLRRSWARAWCAWSSGGYGRALPRVFAAAHGAFIVMGDADDSYDFSEVPRFVEKWRQGNDVCEGKTVFAARSSRERCLASQIHRNPALSSVLNLFFRAGYWRQPLRKCAGSRARCTNAWILRSTGMEFASEFVIRAAQLWRQDCGDSITLWPDKRGPRRICAVFATAGGTCGLCCCTRRTGCLCCPARRFVLIGFGVGVLAFAGTARDYATHYAGRAHHDFWRDFHAARRADISIGAFAKVFSYAERFDRSGTVSLKRVLKRVTLESGLLLGGILFLAGFAGCAWVTWQWVASGFGPLQQVRQVLFWAMWLFLGLQIIFASFFLSMLGISRGTYIGDYDLK